MTAGGWGAPTTSTTTTATTTSSVMTPAKAQLPSTVAMTPATKTLAASSASNQITVLTSEGLPVDPLPSYLTKVQISACIEELEDKVNELEFTIKAVKQKQLRALQA